MIPLRDNQPTRTFPIVTILIIAANVLVYIAQVTSQGAIDASYTMVPYEITHNISLAGQHLTDNQGHVLAVYGSSPHPIWLTIFSSMFMHAGLLHIGGNMLYLWIFGNNIEDALGKLRYIFFYFACGLIAAFAQIATSPNSPIPTLGASGAIAGVLGAYLILYPNARVLTIVPIFIAFLTEIRAIWVLGFWILLQIFQGIGGLGMQRGGGVAYFAHIGGFFAGIVIILICGGQRLAAQQRRPVNYPPPYNRGGYR